MREFITNRGSAIWNRHTIILVISFSFLTFEFDRIFKFVYLYLAKFVALPTNSNLMPSCIKIMVRQTEY